MQNRAVCLVFSLKKYDHVSDHYKRLHWLPLDQFIKFRSVCSMYKQFHQGHSIPLEPPIQFGQSHSHHTRTSSSFAGIVRFNLTKVFSLQSNAVVELFTISVCLSPLQHFYWRSPITSWTLWHPWYMIFVVFWCVCCTYIVYVMLYLYIVRVVLYCHVCRIVLIVMYVFVYSGKEERL